MYVSFYVTMAETQSEAGETVLSTQYGVPSAEHLCHISTVYWVLVFRLGNVTLIAGALPRQGRIASVRRIICTLSLLSLCLLCHCRRPAPDSDARAMAEPRSIQERPRL